MAEAATRKIDQFRQKHPAYKDIPDDRLATALHKKFYAGRSQAEVFERLGVPYPEQLAAPEPPAMQPRPERLAAPEPQRQPLVTSAPARQPALAPAPQAPIQIGPAVALTEQDITPAQDMRTANQLTREYGSLFVRGVADIPAGMARDVSIAGAQRAGERVSILDRIDRGEHVDLDGDPVFGSAGRARADLMRYQAMTPEERARVRPMLEEEFGALDPRERPAYQAGERMSQAVEQAMPVSDRTAQSLPGQVSSGLGSAVGFIGTGVVGRVIGLPPVLSVSIPGSAVSSAGQFQEALQSGASFEDAFAASDIMRAVGVTEAIPIANLFERFDRGTGGRLRGLLINTAAQGGEEAVQEAFQTIMGNLTESTLVGYNPETGVFDGVGDAATVGGIVGAILGALTGFGGRRAATPSQASEIDQRLDAAGARATDIANAAEAQRDQLARPAPETPPAVVPPPVPAPTGDAGLSSQPAAATPEVEEEADLELQEALQAINDTLRGPPEPAPKEELDAVLEAVDAGAKPEEAVDAAAARREQMRVEAEQQAQAAAAGEAQAAADAAAAQQAKAAAQVAAEAQVRVEAEPASIPVETEPAGTLEEIAADAPTADVIAAYNKAIAANPDLGKSEQFLAQMRADIAAAKARAQPADTIPQTDAQDGESAAPAPTEPAPERPTGDAFDAMTAEDWRRRIPELEVEVAKAEATLATERERSGSGVNVNLAKREVAQAKRYVAKARKRLAELEAGTPATPPTPPQDARKPEPAPAAKPEPEAAPAAAVGGEGASEAGTIELANGDRIPAIRDGGETFIRSGEQFVQVFPEADGAYYRVGQDYGSSIDDVRAKAGRRTAVDTPDRARENSIRSRPYEALAALPNATLVEIAKRLKIKSKGVDRNTLIERIVERPSSDRTAAIVAATPAPEAPPADFESALRQTKVTSNRAAKAPDGNVYRIKYEAGDRIGGRPGTFIALRMPRKPGDIPHYFRPERGSTWTEDQAIARVLDEFGAKPEQSRPVIPKAAKIGDTVDLMPLLEFDLARDKPKDVLAWAEKWVRKVGSQRGGARSEMAAEVVAVFDGDKPVWSGTIDNSRAAPLDRDAMGGRTGLTAVHNHPKNGPPSALDITQLFHGPFDRMVVVLQKSGEAWHAERGIDLPFGDETAKLIHQAFGAADAALKKIGQPHINDGRVKLADMIQADPFWGMDIAEGSGVIRLLKKPKRDIPEAVDHLTKELVDAGITAIRYALPDRPAGAVRAEDEVASAPRPDPEDAADGRGEAGDRGSAGDAAGSLTRNSDMRGTAFAVTDSAGNVVASGSVPALGEAAHKTSMAGYYMDMADRSGGALFVGPISSAKAFNTGNLILGMTWEQIQALQQKEGRAPSPVRSKMPAGAVEIYRTPATPENTNNSNTGIRPIRTDTAVTSRGREIPVEYAVIEAADLVASQTDDFSDNPAYPQWLQPRDRSRASSRQQITEMAANLNPRLLGETPNAGQGAPIVGADGFVESGNGRVLAIKRAYQGGKADAYREHLESQGYPVEGMEAPVLVRINRAEMSQEERAAFAREANERDTLSMGAGERAMADAESISDATLELYRGGAVDLAANRPFVRALLEEAVGANQRAGMIRSDGSMAQDAIRRIEAALLAKAYGDPDLVASLVEDYDSDIKAIGGALTDVAAAWSKMRGEAGSEAIDPAMDQTAALLEAVKLVQNARRQGRNVAEFVGQTDMFSGSAISPMARAFLGLMFRNKKQWTQPTGRGKLGAYLRFYVDEAMKTAPGVDLLGLPPVKADDILGLLEGKNDGRPDDQGNLLAQPARRPGEGERGGGASGEERPDEVSGSGRGEAAAGAGREGAGPAGADGAQEEDFDSIFDDALNEQFGQETDGASTASEGLEPDSGGAGAQDGVGGADVPPRRAGARGGARRRARKAGSGQGAAGGDQRVPGDGTTPVGEERDPGVRPPESAPAGEPAGDTDAGGGRKGGRNRSTARRGRKPRAGDAAPTVTESATSAAKNVVMGLDDVTRGLSELFGGGKTIGSGLAFDEDTYRKAVPFFRAGVAHFAEAGADIADMVRALVKHLAGAGMDRAAVERMRPYVQRFVEDVRSGEVDPAADATRQQAVDEAREREVSRETKLEAQRAAEKVEVRVGDLDNIRTTLPFLQPAQQEDVHKAESRLSQPDKHGFMFTNGTGTGKTYVGLGVIKRYARQGKGNVLIVAPSQPILQDWKAAAEDLGLKVSVLESTTDAGKGIVATTYANLGENRHLVDRAWDLVVADESHKLSSAQDGSETDALRTLRAITNHPRGRHHRADQILRDEVDEITSLQAEIKALNSSDDERSWRRAATLQKKLDKALADYRDRRDALLVQFRGEPRSDVTFLSATPFAYDLNVDYGEGYLFDYGEVKGRGYNQPDGRGAFFMQHFGYRMRTGKLTQPEASVNSDVLERAFHEHLKREGSLSGRSLEVEADYERKFVLAEDSIGQKIDEALTFLGEADKGKFRPLLDLVNEKFDYLARMRLLEAIKARRAIPRIKKHLGLGRKVVVFHDYNEGGGINPFVLAPPDKKPGDKDDLKALYAEFLDRNPYVRRLKFGDYRAPIAEITAAFPEAMVYNGTVTPKRRNEIKRQFNEDGSGKNIIIVQSAAGEAGISLHDTTGKHQRVLMNLGMPVRPVTALQEEGRIYRVGQVTNAVFEYLNTGTNWERWTFAQRIASRSSTAENLALGDQARAIRQSFIDAFQESSSEDPAADDGTGGKERDRATNAPISDFERAKTYYYAQGKRSGRRDRREGIDYFATPEPIALKMVEFADIKFGEKVLEPSAGHGAIARFFPEGSVRTVVEPSAELASRAALAAPGARMVTGRFEDLDVGANKFDAIVMNPPFGLDGKTAVEHIAKAAKHLRNGGRIVAIIPTGPAADKRFDAFMDDEERSKNVYLVADMAMPTAMFERAGTSVRTRIVVLEKQTDEDVSPPSQASRDYSNAESVAELFDRIEDAGLAGRSKPTTTEIDVPENGAVTAGGIEFKLRTNESSNRPFWAEPGKIGRGRFFDVARTSERAGGVYDRFERAFQFKTADERQQFLQALENPGSQAQAAASAEPGGEQFDLAETKHSKTGKDLFVATIRDRVERERYTEINAVAKKHGGYYSTFRGKGAVPGFQFPSAEQRAAFVAEITGAEAPRYSLRLTDRAKAKLPALERDLRARLEKLGIADKVALRVVESLGKNNADGMFLGGPSLKIIAIAMDAPDGIGTLNHEVIHALRDLGMFTRSEWRALERAAKADADLLARVRRSYDGLGLTDAQMLEEVVAEHYRMWTDGRTQNGGLMLRAFEKLRNFFRALGQALRGQGFRTAESVFEKIESGKVGRRGDRDVAQPSDLWAAVGTGATIAGVAAKAGMFSGMFALRHPAPGRTALERARGTAGKHVGRPTPLKERIAQWWERATERAMDRSVQATIDRFHSLRRLEERMLGGNQSRFPADHHMGASTSAHFAMNESAYMHAAMYYGPPRLNRAEGVVEFDDSTKSLLTLLEPLDTQDKIDAFELYAWAVRANELKKQGREPAPQSDIDDGLALAREFPDLRQVFDDWTAFNRKVVAFARDSGLITPEAADAYLADGHYVPFYRAEVDSRGRRLADRSMSSGSGIANMRSGIKRLKGSDKAVAGIIDNMVRNTERLIARSYRNIAAQKATALMIGASQQFGEEIIKKPPPKWAIELVPVKMMEEAVAGAGLDVDFSNLSTAEKREMVGVWGMVPPAFRAPDGSMMFSVMIDGKPRWFVTTDPLLFESLSSLTPRQMGMIANVLFQIARAPARMLRWGVTNEPTFAIANFLRDTASTFVVYGAGPGHLARVMARFFKRSASGLVYGERFHDRSVAEIQAAGGGIGGWWSEGPASVRKALQAQRRDVSVARKAGRAAMGFWERYQEVLRASEQANRIVLYARLRAKGTSKAEAAFQAMDVTNFSARGSSEAVRILVELTPFLNARIQGLNRLYRGAAHKLSGNAGPYRSTRAGFVVNGLILMAATMALYAANYDDEDYADLEGWEKDLYYHIRLPRFLEEATGARWFRIPRPFEVGVIFSTLPERAMDQVLRLAGSEAKKDEDLAALRESLFRAATDTFSVQPTQVGKIAIEQWSNWSTFLGRSIVPVYEQEGLPPAMQYGPTTGEAAKWLGKQTGTSPRRIEHLARELGGSMAAHAMVGLDSVITQAQGKIAPAKRWYEMPIISRFIRGESPYTRWAERYYRLQDETDKMVATINKLEREGADPDEIDALDTDEHRDRRKFFKSTRKDLSGIREDMSDIYADPSMTPEAKRQALDELRRERTSIYREVRDLAQP